MICTPSSKPISVWPIGMVVAGKPFSVAMPAHAAWSKYGILLPSISS